MRFSIISSSRTCPCTSEGEISKTPMKTIRTARNGQGSQEPVNASTAAKGNWVDGRNLKFQLQTQKQLLAKGFLATNRTAKNNDALVQVSLHIPWWPPRWLLIPVSPTKNRRIVVPSVGNREGEVRGEITSATSWKRNIITFTAATAT